MCVYAEKEEACYLMTHIAKAGGGSRPSVTSERSFTLPRALLVKPNQTTSPWLSVTTASALCGPLTTGPLETQNQKATACCDRPTAERSMECFDVLYKVSQETFWVPLTTPQSHVITYVNNCHALLLMVSNQSNTEEKQTNERETERERGSCLKNLALSPVCRAKAAPGTYLF